MSNSPSSFLRQIGVALNATQVGIIDAQLTVRTQPSTSPMPALAPVLQTARAAVQNETERKMLDMLRAGARLWEVARATGKAEETVRVFIKSKGIKYQTIRKHVTNEAVERVKTLYCATDSPHAESILSITCEVGYSPTTIEAVIKGRYDHLVRAAAATVAATPKVGVGATKTA